MVIYNVEYTEWDQIMDGFENHVLLFWGMIEQEMGPMVGLQKRSEMIKMMF